MELIRVEGVGKKYGDFWAVRNVSFSVEEGKTCVLLGPSGSGKSTVLKMINRLVEPDEGRIFYRGRDIKEFQPVKLRQDFGYVIQSIGLFPHLTVEENVSILLRQLRWKKEKIDDRVDELLTLVGLDPSVYRKKFPSQLSGGEAQRVGVARALSADPPVLLMDEPFGALDPINRRKLQDEFARLKTKLKKTIIFVTHDIYEAVILGDVIGLMRKGELVQFAEPLALWTKPVDEFVQSFLGSEFGLHVLSKFKVGPLCEKELSLNGFPKISAESTLKDAVSEMIRHKILRLRVVNGEADCGLITFERILEFLKDYERSSN